MPTDPPTELSDLDTFFIPPELNPHYIKVMEAITAHAD